jgi:hypothetical protein
MAGSMLSYPSAEEMTQRKAHIPDAKEPTKTSEEGQRLS